MRYVVAALILASSACASQSKSLVDTEASALTAPATCTPRIATALPEGWVRARPAPSPDGTCPVVLTMREGSGILVVTELVTRNVSLYRYIVEDMHAFEKSGREITNVSVYDELGRYRLDTRDEFGLVSRAYVRTGITSLAYRVEGRWKFSDKEAGMRAIESVVQSLPVTP